tara:strand:- start:1182 stop:1472 length:291 start_codon:yes stop_codon:yes gene_type:complete
MPKNKHYRDVNGHVMSVWDPNDDTKKTAVFSQIKKLIFAPYRVLKGWVVSLDPGNKPKNLTNEEWTRMTQFTKDMALLLCMLFVIGLIAWLTKDIL